MIWIDYETETLLIISNRLYKVYRYFPFKGIAVSGKQVNFLFNWYQDTLSAGQAHSVVTSFIVVKDSDLPTTDLRDFCLYSCNFNADHVSPDSVKQAQPYDGTWYNWR